MTFRLLQVSDTHLSADWPEVQGNFDILRAHVAALRPDLIVHTGDVAMDGADSEADLRFGRDCMAGLAAPCRMLPGNHDVGDYAILGGSQSVNPGRMARWEAVLGDDGFVEDVPGWRLVGLNTQVLGSGLPQEGAQWARLEAGLAGAGDRRIAVFMHKPLCQERLADTQVDYWPVLQAERRRLAALLRGVDCAFIASGHIHQWRDRVADGLRQIWAPPVAFIVGEAAQPSFGSKMLGVVEHLLHPDGRFETRLLPLPGMALHDIGQLRSARVRR